MQKILAGLLLFGNLSFLSALEIEDFRISDIKQAKIEIPAPKMEIDKSKNNAYLWFHTYINESIKEISGYDYSTRIDIRVRKVFDDQFQADIRVNNNYEWVTIRKVFNKDFDISGSAGYVNAREWGGNYNISGNLRDENGKYQYLNLTMFKRFDDGFSFNISANGLYLNVDKNDISGNFDETIYSKKVLGYILSTILAIEANNIK